MPDGCLPTPPNANTYPLLHESYSPPSFPNLTGAEFPLLGEPPSVTSVSTCGTHGSISHAPRDKGILPEVRYVAIQDSQEVTRREQ